MYDRRLSRALLDVLLPQGALGWLVPLVQSPWGEAHGADLHFRGDRHDHGYVEVYFGRTSPLRVCSVKNDVAGEFVLAADPYYSKAAPDLFGPRFRPPALAAEAGRLREYLDHTGAIASQSLIDGEGRLQAMLCRTHGLAASEMHHALILDREVVLGHHGMDEKRRRDGAVRSALGMGDRDPAHNKLDVIAVLDDGRTGLVEVKPLGGDLAKGALQLVAYRYRFQDLAKEWPTWASSGLGKVLQQKTSLRLLPDVAVKATNVVVPILASADERPDWAVAWRGVIAPTRTTHAEALEGLLFWRLSERGEILEVVRA